MVHPRPSLSVCLGLGWVGRHRSANLGYVYYPPSFHPRRPATGTARATASCSTLYVCRAKTTKKATRAPAHLGCARARTHTRCRVSAQIPKKSPTILWNLELGCCRHVREIPSLIPRSVLSNQTSKMAVGCESKFQKEKRNKRVTSKKKHRPSEL